MSAGNDITTEAIRLAMSMNQMRAEYASQNISRSSTPGAQATHLDFASSQGLLEQAVSFSSSSEIQGGLSEALALAASSLSSGEQATTSTAPIDLDEEVADMASANLKYQALTESLNRHFGLMRLATTGRN
jgi:flagellar basal-body rod protein FlgB